MSVFDGLRFRKVYSPIHNLDPRVKFVYVIAVFVVAILFAQIIPLLFLFVLQIPFVLLAHVQRQWLRSLRGAAFLAAFIFAVNLGTDYFTSGYRLTAVNIESAAALTLAFCGACGVFLSFLLNHLARPLRLSFRGVACTLRVCLRLHYRGAFCSRSGGRSPNNNGCAEGPGVGVGEGRFA